MIVMKFGGTSVEDSVAISRLIDIVTSVKERTPFVVVSACSGVTNELIRTATTVASGEKDKALTILDKLKQRHSTIADELLKSERHQQVNEQLDSMFHELRNFVRGVHMLGELSKRSLDAFTSYGERLSSLIINAAMEERGLPSVLLDARLVIITDSTYTSAQPQFSEIEKQAKEIAAPFIAQGKIVVTQGFIGSNNEGITTTIGRGGSDYSAALFGAALNAEEIQIWTDVDGMMTTDPRIVKEARLISQLTFDEASELAYFGAKVLHPSTILPAIKLNIPVRILNSRNPLNQGTLIVQNTIPDENGQNFIIKSIACKKGLTLLNVSSSRMLMAHGFLAELFSVFAKHQKSVDVVATSEVSVSLTVDNEDRLVQIQQELESIAEVRIKGKKAIICVVGEAMKDTPGVAARIFTALAKDQINIEMISEGASEINLTIVVDEQNVEKAVRSLHQEFFQ